MIRDKSLFIVNHQVKYSPEYLPNFLGPLPAGYKECFIFNISTKLQFLKESGQFMTTNQIGSKMHLFGLIIRKPYGRTVYLAS